MLDALHNFTESMPSYLQWLGVIAAGAIPFIESYFGAVIGVMAGRLRNGGSCGKPSTSTASPA